MPLGEIVENWTPRKRPQRVVHEGRLVRLEPLDAARHGPAMHAAHRNLDPDGRLWDYLPYGPFDAEADYLAHLERQAASDDPLFFAIVDRASGDAVGVASYLRHDPENGVIEVGHVCYTPRLQHTAGATEAMALMARHVFEDLDYRRYEWKCNAGNAASVKAAERLGFAYEGTFRQHMVVKGRNRDTAWFAMIDVDWPAIGEGLRLWLRPENFGTDGRQRASLMEIRGVGEHAT